MEWGRQTPQAHRVSGEGGSLQCRVGCVHLTKGELPEHRPRERVLTVPVLVDEACRLERAEHLVDVAAAE